MLTNYNPWAKSCQLSILGFTEHSHAIHFILSMATFVLEGQSSIVAIETYGLESLNYLLSRKNVAVPGCVGYDQRILAHMMLL